MLMPGNSPLADFDQPLDMLQDCHRRVERFLAMLARAGDEAPSPLDAEWRNALHAALEYFTNAAPLHTQDEEVSLFPRLRMHANRPDVATALAVVERLEHEHDEAAILHAEHDRTGRAWLMQGDVDAADRRRFVELSTRLRAIYVEHIRAEEAHVFVTARSALDADELQAIGVEMRERRETARADALTD
jgi:hemerythrin-like domain-containing protein